MILVDGCHYLGCEDVATTHHTVADDELTLDVFLCAGHGPWVASGQRRKDRRLVVVDDPNGKTRVKVIVDPPKGSASR